jgi:UDP-N-acetylglucosamine 2-epimerase (non-hydrolysing)
MNLLFIFGTRPEAIKMAPIILALRDDTQFGVKICLTAQHRQMLDQEMKLFGIIPDYDLNIMQSGQDLFDITSRALIGLRDVIDKARPDFILVQGDTTTALVGAIAAFYKKIPVAHIEAGLRTWDPYAPFPEEINRTLVSKIAKLHFAPTQRSKENLLREGIADETIYVTGNTVIDALLWVRNKVANQRDWDDIFGSAQTLLANNSPIILVTGHRRENFGDNFINICDALVTLAKNHPDWHIVYPVHLNPNVQIPVKSKLSQYANIHLLEPLSYAPFVYLMSRAQIILTDSGGIQEEGPALGKPILVMREVTERPEAIAAGTAILVGANTQRIVYEVEKLMQDKIYYAQMARAVNPFGDGTASKKIIEVLVRELV